jgi:hypothetical protein
MEKLSKQLKIYYMIKETTNPKIILKFRLHIMQENELRKIL